MVIKGQSVAGAKRLAVHLQRTDTNERMEVLELRGVAAGELTGALAEIDAVASGTRCRKPFYHASINTRADERLTEAQRLQAIDRLERELNLAGQPRVVVLHEKEGREHCHIVWSRIDLERMAAISDSHNYRRHELVARELERDFGHARVQGAHIERDGRPRPERTPSHDEMQQAGRSGIAPQDARAWLTQLWRQTENGQAFQAGLESGGWLLARGDRRDFVVVDPAAHAHSLARRIDGAKAADLRERMADIDRAALPSVAEACRYQRGRIAGREGRGEGGVAADGFAPVIETGKAGSVPESDRVSPAGHTESALDAGARAVETGLVMAADTAGRAAEKLTDFVAGLAESLGGAAPCRYGAAELAGDAAARRDHYARQAADRRSDEALDRMRLDLEQGRGLNPQDVRSLTEAHLVQLKAHGDAYLRQAIADRERETERDRAGGSARER